MQYQWKKRIVEITQSPLRIAIAVVLTGMFAGMLECGVHVAAQQAHASPLVKAALDATMVAIAAAIIALRVLMGARERYQRVREDLRRIANLNHHIRNALQVVVQSQYLPHPEEQKDAVLASVDRIDQTLRELFPVVGAPPLNGQSGIQKEKNN